VPLSAERKQYIRDLVNDEWVDRLPSSEPERDKEFKRLSPLMDKELEGLLKKTSSAEELHELALAYNWDKGVDNLIDLIRNPACDKNTALLVFWRSGVDYYQETYSKREDIEEWDLDKQSTWDMVHFIMDKVSTGAYGAAKMPANFLEDIYKAKKPIWEIPSSLFGPKHDGEIKNVTINSYDKKFSAYGPHCYFCRKAIQSYNICKCPHCLKSFQCDCESCREERGEA